LGLFLGVFLRFFEETRRKWAVLREKIRRKKPQKTGKKGKNPSAARTEIEQEVAEETERESKTIFFISVLSVVSC